jgi:type I restriction enzyme M protein
MNHAQHSSIVSFIWGIADDVLRDLYVRGKYRDVILPMVVIRRLDCLLEPTKQAVLDMKVKLDAAKVVNQEGALRQAAGQPFYNVSPFTLRDLLGKPKQLRENFVAYLDGYSRNVQEIIEKFKFRNQIPTLAEADALGHLIAKFLDRNVNLSNEPVYDTDGRVRLPKLDNHSMGTIFEELIRRFNEENNEEAGEHFTPRDVVRLMADLILLPIADQIKDSTYTVYDGACGTGGMLTVAEDRLKELAGERGKKASIHLYGQEVNPETYAITKADLLLKGEGEEAENFTHGSSLSQDGHRGMRFDLMISNPPYGKSWKMDLERMGGKGAITDARFIIQHAGEPDYSLITRSSDGQLLFLANMVAKMKHDTPLGSRIAEVHNGSSLFTGDAGQGESNIRRWIMENDWLEAVIALPLNMFYNTGIATYIWILTNRKPERRKGKVQLIDATEWYRPLCKNLGKKNCELSDDQVRTIVQTFLDFKETPKSKVFPREAFGYWKIVVERPLRLRAQFTKKAIESLRFASGEEELRQQLWDNFGHAIYDEFHQVRPEMENWLKGEGQDDAEDGEDEAEEKGPKARAPEKKRKKLLDASSWDRDKRLVEAARELAERIGAVIFEDYNIFARRVEDSADGLGLSAAERKQIARAMSWRDENAPPVVAKVHAGKRKTEPQPLYGLYEVAANGHAGLVEYEPDSDFRDTEQVPLLEVGGIEAFFRREVLTHVPDAWIDRGKTKIGYEISFTRYFYQPPRLRSLEEIRADILALESESDGLLEEIVGSL